MAKKVTRKTWAKVGWILSIIGAILLLIFSVLGLLGTTIGFVTSGVLGGFIGEIVGIIIAVIILLLEFDVIILQSHLVRGIIYIILGVLGPGGLLVILGGIFYILAEFLDK